MIELHYNETVSVNRLTDVEGTNKKEYVEIIDALSCMIQPMDPSISQDLPGGFGKEFLMFCETADVQEGDRVIRDGKEYRVSAVEKLNWQGMDHMEVSIRIFES